MDSKKIAVGAIAVAALALDGGTALAAGQNTSTTPQGSTTQIDKAAAEKAALSTVPGQVLNARADEDGENAYNVNVKDQNGKVHEVKVDASSGQVIENEAADGPEGSESGADNGN